MPGTREPDPPSPLSVPERVQDLINQLLGSAMGVSYAAARLQDILDHSPHADPGMLADIALAIETLATVQDTLIHDADRLAEQIESTTR